MVICFAHLDYTDIMATQTFEDFRDGVDVCYVDDLIDEKALNSSKLRLTNGFTEIFIIVNTPVYSDSSSYW